jgi:hypothetical protein
VELPRIFADRLEKQELDPAIIRKDPGGNHSRVVQHDEILGAHEAGKVAKAFMFDGAPRPIEHHHPRIFSPRERIARDQFLRKWKIVIASETAHGVGAGLLAFP